jgi:hypothetical protein
MSDIQDEYVVGTYGTTYKAIDVFRTGETQGIHNERLRIIELLESLDDGTDWIEIQLDKLIALIKGEK